ncbi:hypothetical protein M0802_015580 [Mischocyttarus mexicanus]|nr:hypothetical protein M0802_015580 [Mischocyttarus mexicanus]
MILGARKLRSLENIWLSVVQQCAIKPDYRLARLLDKVSDQVGVTIMTEFLETIPVRPKSPLHAYFMHRAATETLTYGTMPLYRWFHLFASCFRHTRELRYLAGIVMQCEKDYQRPSVIVAQRDNSQLKEVPRFYNMNNILECLLNIFELRSSQIKKIRGYLSYSVRRAGTMGENITYYEHVGSNPVLGNVAAELRLREVPKEKMRPFTDAKSCHDGLAEDEEEHNTDKDSFVRACSFLQNIMLIAGYGRACKFVASPRSKPDRTDDYNGISTSAGVATKKIAIRAKFRDGNEELLPSVPVSKKLAIGASSGDFYFLRSTIATPLTVSKPGTSGSRDVPYKASRPIYVIPLHTMHAMVAAVWHIVNYVSSSGSKIPYAVLSEDAGHIASGMTFTTGVRVIDTMDVLSVSGNKETQ